MAKKKPTSDTATKKPPVKLTRAINRVRFLS
jgi:hypothetical protein